MIGAATEKARLPRFSFVLGIESCCEVDDLSCLGMFRPAGRCLQLVRLIWGQAGRKGGYYHHVRLSCLFFCRDILINFSTATDYYSSGHGYYWILLYVYMYIFCFK